MSRHSILVQWSEDDKAFIAIVPELPGLSAFGSSPEEAMEELSTAKEAYLEVLQEDGEEIPEPDVLRPFSGQTRLRLPKSLHASLSFEAKRDGVSLNTYIVMLLSTNNSLNQIKDSINELKTRIHTFMLTGPFPLSETTETTRSAVLSNDLYLWAQSQQRGSSEHEISQ